MTEKTLPAYRELADGTSRSVFGAGDQLGCLNLLTADRVKAAACLIRSGEVINLNAPLTWPDPNPFGIGPEGRRTPIHHVLRTPSRRDDHFDSFFPQSGSQWDGFLHIRDRERECFYNGNTDESIGIEVFAEHGIVGRGVLLDVERWAAGRGRQLEWNASTAISVADLEACADAQGVSVQEGTILIVRVGWESGWNGATHTERQAIADDQSNAMPGIEASIEMVQRLWDWGIAAIASDSPALEIFPPGARYIHVDLLCRLGIPIGELWHLEKLAGACAAEGRYEFFLTSAPLNMPGGIGSTANALAIL